MENIMSKQTKTCMNCNKYKSCAYKFGGVCEEWTPNSLSRSYASRAKQALTKPISDWERQFLSSCSTRKSFSEPMLETLLPIFERVGV